MNIIEKKYIYFFISLLIIIPGLISLLFYRLHVSIDFTGGSRLELQNVGKDVKEVIQKQGLEVSSIQETSNNSIIVRTKPLDSSVHEQLIKELTKKYPSLKEISSQTVGPTIGSETTINAVKAVLVASVLIVLYISWAFRKVPRPASSWRFGICAIVALLHDVLVLFGIFSLLGHFYQVEIDSLFVTALLTVIGFSVHDTIVVFDRIRENLLKYSGVPFAVVVNESIVQTLGRSLKTSLTVILVLLALLLFGGESTRWFIIALLVGIISGTYSSIFNAAPLLVWWQEFSLRHSGNSERSVEASRIK